MNAQFYNLAGVFLLSGLLFANFVDAQDASPSGNADAALAHDEKGVQAMKSGDYSTAVSEFRKSVELTPNVIERRLALVKAYIAAERIKTAWPVLRATASMAPGNKEVANLFSRYWNMFDRKGVFNVGQPISNVVGLLGNPDQTVDMKSRERVVYGYYAVDSKEGKVHELLDLRGIRSEHLSPSEYISVDLDGRGWRCDYRAVNQIASTAEYVLPKERIQNWTELVDVQRLHGLTTRGVELEQLVEGMMSNLQKSNPDRTYRVIDVQPQSILFEWKTGGSDQSVAQHELVRMFAGPRDVHRLAYTKKVKNLENGNRVQWLKILRAAKLTPVDG